MVRASRWHIAWLYGVLLSLSYEHPIILVAGMDRASPRLFDIFACLGAVFILPTLRGRTRLPSSFWFWGVLVFYFSLCAMFWASFLVPFEYGRFSLFYAFKYGEGLVVVFIALCIPLNALQKRRLMWVITIGGVFVGLYALHEYFSVSRYRLIISEEKITYVSKGTLLGPLGYTYLHIASFSSMAFLMTLSLCRQLRGSRRWLMYGIAMFVMWPTLFCGSRTAVALVALGLPLFFLLRKGVGKTALVLLFVVGVMGVFVSGKVARPDVIEADANLTMQRVMAFEDGDAFDDLKHNSVMDRMLAFQHFDMSSYLWGGVSMPLIGAGFYIAPTEDPYTKERHYRVGYGFHNAYVFAFEQGGMIAFFLYLSFLFATYKQLNKMRRSHNMADADFATGAMAFFVPMLIVDMTGGIFWLNVGTVNLNMFLLLIFFLASKSSTPTYTYEHDELMCD